MKKNRMKVRIKASDHRNEPHFDHLRNYHPTTITESRKFRKPKHKKNWMDEAEDWTKSTIKILDNLEFRRCSFSCICPPPWRGGGGRSPGEG